MLSGRMFPILMGPEGMPLQLAAVPVAVDDDPADELEAVVGVVEADLEDELQPAASTTTTRAAVPAPIPHLLGLRRSTWCSLLGIVDRRGS